MQILKNLKLSLKMKTLIRGQARPLLFATAIYFSVLTIEAVIGKFMHLANHRLDELVIMTISLTMFFVWMVKAVMKADFVATEDVNFAKWFTALFKFVGCFAIATAAWTTFSGLYKIYF